MIIVSSDWHLDAVTAGVPRFDDVNQKVMAILEKALLQGDGLDAFVFCGDLCNPDTPRAWKAVEVAVRVAATLDREEIPTLWLNGNHDVLADGSGASVLDPLRSIGLVASGPIHGCFHSTGRGRMVNWIAFPFAAVGPHAYDPEAWVEKVQPTGPIDLVFSHLNVEGIVPGSETTDFARGRQVFLPTEVIRRRWPAAKIIQGHYHRPQMKRADQVTVVGSLELFTRADEGEARGYLEVS